MRIVISSLLLTSALALSACTYATQTTSGRDWLKVAPPKTVNMEPGNIDSAIRDVAAVEPTLRFPARIGIAHLDHGQLVGMSGDEAKAWAEAAGRLGEAYGEFVPVSPLVAAMVQPYDYKDNNPYTYKSACQRCAIEGIRLAAARQHLDAVVVYESDATADTKSNPLSITEWTLIGAFVVPTENVKAQGIAQAILLDVRNGYPYGTVEANADDSTLSTRFGRGDIGESLKDRVRAAAVEKLAGETESMVRKLRPELAALDRKTAK